MNYFCFTMHCQVTVRQNYVDMCFYRCLFCFLLLKISLFLWIHICVWTSRCTSIYKQHMYIVLAWWCYDWFVVWSTFVYVCVCRYVYVNINKYINVYLILASFICLIRYVCFMKHVYIIVLLRLLTVLSCILLL